jgi:hypothetical protein
VIFLVQHCDYHVPTVKKYKILPSLSMMDFLCFSCKLQYAILLKNILWKAFTYIANLNTAQFIQQLFLNLGGNLDTELPCKNARNSAKFRGIPSKFYCKNAADFRGISRNSVGFSKNSVFRRKLKKQFRGHPTGGYTTTSWWLHRVHLLLCPSKLLSMETKILFSLLLYIPRYFIMYLKLWTYF